MALIPTACWSRWQRGLRRLPDLQRKESERELMGRSSGHLSEVDTHFHVLFRPLCQAPRKLTPLRQ